MVRFGMLWYALVWFGLFDELLYSLSLSLWLSLSLAGWLVGLYDCGCNHTLDVLRVINDASL
jgi:hypothetical protein